MFFETVFLKVGRYTLQSVGFFTQSRHLNAFTFASFPFSRKRLGWSWKWKWIKQIFSPAWRGMNRFFLTELFSNELIRIYLIGGFVRIFTTILGNYWQTLQFSGEFIRSISKKIRMKTRSLSDIKPCVVVGYCKLNTAWKIRPGLKCLILWLFTVIKIVFHIAFALNLQHSHCIPNRIYM